MNRGYVSPEVSLRRFRRQAGASLIEVMVGLTVGLFVIGAAIRMATSTLASSSAVSDVTRLNLQAQVVMDTVGRHIRQSASHALVAADSSAPAVQVVWAQPAVLPTGALALGPVSAEPASLRVFFHSQTPTTDYPAATTTPLAPVPDCQGRSAANGVNDVTFSLDAQRVLRCNNQSGNGAQPLLDDVQAFAWRAVQRDANGNLTYLTPQDAVGNLNLNAVEVCLQLRGQLTNASTNNAQTIVNCQGKTVTPADGRVHRVYRQLFTMRSLAG
jgi:type IV pilus assembly protein PilW